MATAAPVESSGDPSSQTSDGITAEQDVLLPAAVATVGMASAPSSPRFLSFSSGLALVLGIQIGSGIFVSPSLVARNAESVSAALLTWTAAGLLTWACAACYVDIATRMPVNGGPQEYIARCFGDRWGFIVSWGCIFAVKPCSTAILGFFVADYICDAIGYAAAGSDLAKKITALAIIAIVSAVNCKGNRLSDMSTKFLLACKVIGVGFVIVVGFAVLIVPSLRPEAQPAPFEDHGLSAFKPGSYTDAFVAAMYSYSGWETLAYVGGELKDPSHNIPRVLNLSMIIVIALFAFANVAYFSALTFDEVASSTTIGLTFSRRFLGSAGTVLYAVVICLSSLGALNVKTFTAGRLTQAAADRRYLPLLMKTVASSQGGGITSPAELHSRSLNRPFRFGDGTIPFSAIVFNAVLAAIYVAVGDLTSLIAFMGIIEYSVVFSTLMGLVYLRVRHRRNVNHGDAPSAVVEAPLLLIAAASLAVFFMVSLSVLRHPLSGFGFMICCIVTGSLYRVVV